VLVLFPLEGFGRIDEAVVGGVDGISTTLSEGDEVDAANHPLVLARPELPDQPHLVGVGLVEDAVGPADQGPTSFLRTSGSGSRRASSCVTESWARAFGSVGYTCAASQTLARR
jgi:hypothetical protein